MKLGKLEVRPKKKKKKKKKKMVHYFFVEVRRKKPTKGEICLLGKFVGEIRKVKGETSLNFG